MTATKKLPPVHPGEILLKEFLEPLGVTQYRLAKDTGVPQPRISDITKRRRSITADTALRLGAFFGTSAEFWLNLQNRFDLEMARDEQERQQISVTSISAERPVRAVARKRARPASSVKRRRAVG